MTFIRTLISSGYITSSQGRLIELFILGALISLGIGLIDNIDILIAGGTVDWLAFVKSFLTTTILAITAAYRKELSDQAIANKELLEKAVKDLSK